MRILCVTHYFEPDSGAAAVRLSRLAHLLHQRGHEITLLTTLPHYPQGKISPGYRGRFSLVEEREGLRVIRAWLWATESPRISRKMLSQLSFMISGLLRGIAVSRPDVVLIEAQPVFTGWMGGILARLKRAPYVLNVSDLWPDHLLSVGALSENHPAYRLARRIVDASYRGAAGIAAMSPAWAAKIAEYSGKNESIQTIYNGVDLARFRPDLDSGAFRQKYGLGPEKILSFIGTFATQYDFSIMLDLAAELASRRDVQIVFIGAGSQQSMIQQRLKTRPLPNFTLIDWIPHDEVPLAWAASHVSFWAMRDEALYQGTIPAKLYEALACGVPVAAAMAGEGADFVVRSGGGIVCAPGDFAGLQAAVSRLLDDDLFHAAARKAGRDYAEAHFDPEKVAEAYERLLIQAVTSHGGMS